MNVAKVKGDAVVKAAEKEAAQILAIAEAEGNSAACLVKKREFDYQAKKTRIETQLAAAVPLVISGKSADELIQRTVTQAVACVMIQ